MKMMKNAIVAQSGGPTTAINASLAGVIKGCLESHEIDVLYGALNGVEGLMDERLVNLTDIFDHNEENLNVLKLTPAMYLGSCRRKLKDVDQDSSEYDIIINIFRKYHIHYFFYIGGNDSMDTVGKMSRYVKEHQMDVKVIGIPKTIDNDLVVTDHTPDLVLPHVMWQHLFLKWPMIPIFIIQKVFSLRRLWEEMQDG